MAKIALGTTGFVVVDSPEAPAAVGVARAGKKILDDGATWLARHITYAYAIGEQQVTGCSIGVSFGTGDRQAAIDTAAAAWPPEGGRNWRIEAKTADLAPFAAGDPISDPARLAASAIAAAQGWLSSLEGLRVAATGPAAAHIETRATAVGATLADTDGPTDVVFLGAKASEFDHHAAETCAAAVVVPYVAQVVTARGRAVAQRRNVAVLADFLAGAGALWEGDIDAVAERVRTRQADLDRSEHGPYLDACLAAEKYLRTWCAELPFGRPLG